MLHKDCNLQSSQRVFLVLRLSRVRRRNVFHPSQNEPSRIEYVSCWEITQMLMFPDGSIAQDFTPPPQK